MKKFMFYLMVLNTFVASIVTIVVLAMGDTSIPTVVLVLRGALILGAAVLIVKKYVSWVRRSEMTAYYLVEAAVAVFNLIFLSAFVPADVSFFEYAITGTLITPVLNLLLVFLLCKLGGRYATFENITEPVTVGTTRSVSTQAVKQN